MDSKTNPHPSNGNDKKNITTSNPNPLKRLAKALDLCREAERDIRKGKRCHITLFHTPQPSRFKFRCQYTARATRDWRGEIETPGTRCPYIHWERPTKSDQYRHTVNNWQQTVFCFFEKGT